MSPRVLADDAPTAGAVREAAVRISLNQPGDPKRLAQAMLQPVASPTPPLRLPLGIDTRQAIDEVQSALSAETGTWRALGASTDFPAGQ